MHSVARQKPNPESNYVIIGESVRNHLSLQLQTVGPLQNFFFFENFSTLKIFKQKNSSLLKFFFFFENYLICIHFLADFACSRVGKKILNQISFGRSEIS